MYPRKLYPSLKEHLASPQITVLTGMRRTGKTTLVKQLLAESETDNKLFIDLERVDNRELFSEKNYDAILYRFQQLGLKIDEPLIIGLDELQLAPNAPSVLKYLSDHYHIKFIATGSSSYYLKNLFSESLAGRKKIFELFPLDFGEFLTFKGVPFSLTKALPSGFNPSEYERLKPYYEEYVTFGGFPEVVLTMELSKKQDMLKDIVSSYINIDVKSLADIRHQDQLFGLMKLLASRVGSKLDSSKIAKIIGISRHTVQSYLDFLEKTYIIRRIPVMANSPDRQLVKAKKCYFLDNGLLHSLAEISSGSSFENAVFTQLHHRGELHFFSLKTGKEIDFILNRELAIEVKESPTAQDQETLTRLATQAELKQQLLIGRNPVPTFKNYLWGGELR